MDQEDENRVGKFGAASLISSGEDDTEIVVRVPRIVPVHVRTIRVGIAEIREIAIGIDVIFVSCHLGLRRHVPVEVLTGGIYHVRALLPIPNKLLFSRQHETSRNRWERRP